MTDNVVHLPKPDRRLWVCVCGCRSFNLMADGTIECSACDLQVLEPNGGWLPPDSSAPPYSSGPEPFSNLIFGNGKDAADFARRRVLSDGKDEDTAAIVVLKADGGISSWSVIETKAQYKWLRRKLTEAASLINPRRRGYDRET